MRFFGRSILLATTLAGMLAMSGCSSFWSMSHGRQVNSSSLVKFLYPDGQQSQIAAKAQSPTLELPLKVGLAFVPESGHSAYRLSQADKSQLQFR